VKKQEQEKTSELVSINTYKFDPTKTYLVVNGKVKEIGTKSKYILDMLIIEED
jgi:hypothetical protein